MILVLGAHSLRVGKVTVVVGVLAVAALTVDIGAAKAARQAALATIPKAAYNVVHDWPVLPDNTIFEEVSSVAVDSLGNVLVLQRAGRKWPDSDLLDQIPIVDPTVFVIQGRTGSPFAMWGQGSFALPHSLTVDSQDNVWITDVALHQVFKFSHDGRLLLTLGERGVAGHDNSHFNRPTDVAVGSDGSFYVSDGYENSRVMKFARDGKFLLTWGTKGNGPGQLTCHTESLLMPLDECSSWIVRMRACRCLTATVTICHGTVRIS
jgi:DNA-binding beta-propeller fold protein YncE